MVEAISKEQNQAWNGQSRVFIVQVKGALQTSTRRNQGIICKPIEIA
jgi:nitrogen regulatory protein PII